MEFADAPHRPPPPPPPPPPSALPATTPPPLRMPPRRTSESHSDDRLNPYYIDSPEQVSSPPSFADALIAASPTSPPRYTPYSPAGSDPLSRSLTLTSAGERFTDEDPYAPDHEDTRPYQDAPPDQPPPPPPPQQQAEEEESDEDEEIPDLPPLILITGANSGLGLALFKHFAAREPSTCPLDTDIKYDVVGIDKLPWRLPGKGFQWQADIGKSGKFVQLDVTAGPKRYRSFCANYLYATVTTPEGKRRRYPRSISLLLHCAGGRGLVPGVVKAASPGDAGATAAAAAAAAGSLAVMDADTMRRAYDVNVVGTLGLAQAVLPHLRLEGERVRERRDEVTAAFGGDTDWLDQLRAQGSRASLSTARPLPPRDPPPRVVVLGSRRVGGGGGGYAYRASEAAVNSVLRGLSVDVPEVCFALVRPGRVEAELGKGDGGEVIGCEECLEALLPLVEKLGDGKLTSGCFVDRLGDPIEQ